MKRIILIEDDQDIRALFPMIFDPQNYDVRTLNDGHALLSDEIEKPDLFILDKNLSGMSGLDLCRFIKSNSRFNSVPVLMLSASPDITELAEAAGADGVITKPFTLDTIRKIVARFTS